MRNEKWYQRRLSQYFDKHYSNLEDDAEFWPDPAPNQWLFDIRFLGYRVELTCDDNGTVHEQIYGLAAR